MPDRCALAMLRHPVLHGERCPTRRVVNAVDVMLVGRSAERKVLGGLLTRAADGYSGALVLRGETGVGKTALLDETAAGGRGRTPRLATPTPRAFPSRPSSTWNSAGRRPNSPAPTWCVRRMAAPPAPPPRRAKAAAHRA